MDVGFIGLGAMGSGMAGRLLEAGHSVTVFNRSREKAELFAARGAKVANSVAETCRGDAVFTMLADDNAVHEIVFGERGVLSERRVWGVQLSPRETRPCRGASRLSKV